MEQLDVLLLLARTVAMTFFIVEAIQLLIYARHSYIYRMYGLIQLMMGLLYGLTIYSSYFSATPPFYSGQLNLLWNLVEPAIIILCYEILKGRKAKKRYIFANFFPFILVVLIYSVNNNHLFLEVMGWLSLAYATIAMTILLVMMVKEIRRHKIVGEKRAYGWFAVVMWTMYLSLFLRVAMSNVDIRFAKIVTVIVMITVYAILTYLLRRGLLDFHNLQQEQFEFEGEESVSPKASQAIIRPVMQPKKSIVEAPTGEQPFFMQDQVSFYGDKARQLNELMENKQLYLQPDLSMGTLSMELGTNRTYLSNLINQYLHTTFSNYVNTFRVKYAKNLLLNSEDTIEDIFQASGFQSRTTFWRAFAQMEGCTPKEFRKRKASQSY